MTCISANSRGSQYNQVDIQYIIKQGNLFKMPCLNYWFLGAIWQPHLQLEGLLDLV